MKRVCNRLEKILPNVKNHYAWVHCSEIVSLLERGSFGVLSLLDEVCIYHNHPHHHHHHLQHAQMAPPPLFNHTPSGGGGGGGGSCGTGSGSSTPSLALSADEAFAERLADRFAQVEHILVVTAGNRQAANASTAPNPTESATDEGEVATRRLPV